MDLKHLEAKKTPINCVSTNNLKIISTVKKAFEFWRMMIQNKLW